jgi:hypothetical protein
MKYPEATPLADSFGGWMSKFDTPVIFDFDGVLAVPIWPDRRIGPAIQEGINMLQHYAEQGFKIVIFTSRPWHDQPFIKDWVEFESGVDVEVICGKPLATLYIDDRAVRFERIDE